MAEHFKNYINGQWVDAISGETFENRNPSDIHEVIGLFPRSKKEDVDRAVSAALSASNEWKNIPPPERGKILNEAGLPKRVLNLIHGFGTEAGDALVNHPDVSMISFTGSSAIGKIIGTNC